MGVAALATSAKPDRDAIYKLDTHDHCHFLTDIIYYMLTFTKHHFIFKKKLKKNLKLNLGAQNEIWAPKKDYM